MFILSDLVELFVSVFVHAELCCVHLFDTSLTSFRFFLLYSFLEFHNHCHEQVRMSTRAIVNFPDQCCVTKNEMIHVEMLFFDMN